MLTSLVLALLLTPQLVDRTNEAPVPIPDESVSPEQRADIYMARKMYREAAETYQKALDAQPDSARLYNKLGIAYHHRLMWDEAKHCYRKAAKLDKSFSQALNNLGTVFYANGRPKKAGKFYKKALKQSPNSASIHSNLGTAFFARKKYKKAAEQYARALELDPNVFEHRGTVGTLLQQRSVEERAKYHYFLARAYAKNQMYERALLYLRRALEEGYDRRSQILNEAVFEPLHENPLFRRLLSLDETAEYHPE